MICIIWLFITWVFPLLVFCGFLVRCIETYFHDLSSFQGLSLDPCLVFAVFSVARGWEDGVIVCWHSQVYWAFFFFSPPDLKVAASLVMRKVSLVSFGGGFWVISTERSLWIPVHFHLGGWFSKPGWLVLSLTSVSLPPRTDLWAKAGPQVLVPVFKPRHLFLTAQSRASFVNSAPSFPNPEITGNQGCGGDAIQWYT